MITFLEFCKLLDEDGVPANCAGAGGIASIGIGPEGEPGVSPQTQKKHKKAVLRGILSTINLGN